MTREQRLTEIFVTLTDSLVDDFDVVDLLQTLADASVELLDVDGSALMLRDEHGEPRGVAASSEQARVLELFEVRSDDGPCIDCLRTGRQVVNTTPAESARRWPLFTQAAEEMGFAQTHALPMRLRGEVIGAMNLVTAKPGALDDSDVRMGQALCDIATITILQERQSREKEVLAEQLQNALNSRVLIEQATGVLAERMQVSMPDAFATMRRYARNRSDPLRQVAHGVIDGTVTHNILTSS